MPIIIEDKEGIKQNEDAAPHIDSFLGINDASKAEVLNLSNDKLIDVIRSYDPEFTLEKYLEKKRQKKESLIRKIYDIIQVFIWSMYIKRETFETKHSVIPKKIVAITMILDITCSIKSNAALKLYELLECNTEGMSKKYPVIICGTETAVRISMDIPSLDIPNELRYLTLKHRGHELKIDDTFIRREKIFDSTGIIRA